MRALGILIVMTLLVNARASAAQSLGNETGFEAPDSARIVSLSAQLRAKQKVRIETRADERLELYGADATGAGLNYRSAVATSGITAIAARDVRQIDWDQVRSIEAPGHGAGRGAVVGLALGLVAGAVADASAPCHDDFLMSCQDLRALALPLYMGLGAGFGALTGAVIGHGLSWQRIYP